VTRGTFKIIRVDGTETVHETQPDFKEIRRILGCEHLDYVTLNRRRQTIMLVDDTGMIDGKPVNEKATARYHRICKPGTVHQIHGDVAIINDTV
jgi:hypothetical protein